MRDQLTTRRRLLAGSVVLVAAVLVTGCDTHAGSLPASSPSVDTASNSSPYGGSPLGNAAPDSPPPVGGPLGTTASDGPPSNGAPLSGTAPDSSPPVGAPLGTTAPDSPPSGGSPLGPAPTAEPGGTVRTAAPTEPDDRSEPGDLVVVVEEIPGVPAQGTDADPPGTVTPEVAELDSRPTTTPASSEAAPDPEPTSDGE
jgi:hypothetical protein